MQKQGKKPHKINHDFLKEFGEHVRKLREERGFSLRGFAGSAELEYSTVSAIELGRTNTTLSTAMTIAEALEITHQELFSFQYPFKGKK